MKLQYKKDGNILTIAKNMSGGLLIETYHETDGQAKLCALAVIEKEDIGKMMELLKELVKPDIDNHKPERWTIVR